MYRLHPNTKQPNDCGQRSPGTLNQALAAFSDPLHRNCYSTEQLNRLTRNTSLVYSFYKLIKRFLVQCHDFFQKNKINPEFPPCLGYVEIQHTCRHTEMYPTRDQTHQIQAAIF